MNAVNPTRTMRSRDLVRICLRRAPSGPQPQAVPTSRTPRRPATNWPATRNVDIVAAPCGDSPTGVAAADTTDSAPAPEGDTDPPSPGRHAARGAAFAGALVLGGALMLGFSAPPASAQDSGSSDGGTSSSMGSGVGASGSSDGGTSSSMGSGVGASGSSDGGTSSSDGGGMSSSDGGMSSSSSDGGMSSGCCSSSSSSTFSSSSYGSSDSGYGGDTSVSTSDASTDSSTDSGFSTTDSYGSTADSGYGTVSTDSGYGVTSTGSTGFEGSPETGPAHATAVNTGSSTWGGSTDTSDSSETAAATRSISVSSDSDTGTSSTSSYSTGFEGSPETGPAHATAVNTDSSTWGGSTETGATGTGYTADDSMSLSDTEGFDAGLDSGLTGFEGSPEMGPAHAVAVNTESPTWGPDPTPTGFEGSPEVGPAHAYHVNADAPVWSGDVTPTGFENSPELQGLAWDMRDAEEQARINADQVRQALTDMGLDPNRFNPDQLRSLVRTGDPRYSALADSILGFTEGIRNPLRGDDRIARAYAPRGLETLDTEGTRATMGAINQFAWNEANLGESLAADVRTTMADPMAVALAYATESPIAPESVFEGLRNLDSRWQQHQLGQLLNAGWSYDPVTGATTRVPGVSYEPGQLARFADAVMDFSRTHQDVEASDDAARFGMYATNPLFNPAVLMDQGTLAWDGDIHMQSPEAAALRALTVNPDAAWQFTGMRPQNIATIVRPSEGRPGPLGLTIPARGTLGLTGEESARLSNLVDQYAADTMRAALLDAVRQDPSRFPAGLDRYADVNRQMARAVPTSEPVRVAYADVLGGRFQDLDGRPLSYVDAIGQAAMDQRYSPYTPDADFARPTLFGALREAGVSPAAASRIGEVMTYWTADRASPLLGDDHVTQADVERALQPNALVLDVVREAFEDIGIPTESQQALAKSIRDNGAIVGAVAGPIANLLGGLGSGGGAFAAGFTGSATWAGTTAIADSFAEANPPPYHGDDLTRSLVGGLRQNFANTIAARNGLARPTGQQVADTLTGAPAFSEVGDPFRSFVSLMANEGYLNARRGQTEWGSLR